MLFQTRASRRVEELIQELVTAAEEGDICTVRSLVERDVPLDCEDVFMHTALVGRRRLPSISPRNALSSGATDGY